MQPAQSWCTPRVAWARIPSRPSSTGRPARLAMVGGRSAVGSGSSSGPSSASAANGGGVSAGDQRDPSQNWRERGRYVTPLREPSAATSTVMPASPAISVWATPPASHQIRSSSRTRYVRASSSGDHSSARPSPASTRNASSSSAWTCGGENCRPGSIAISAIPSRRAPAWPARRRRSPASAPISRRTAGTSSTWKGTSVGIGGACHLGSTSTFRWSAPASTARSSCSWSCCGRAAWRRPRLRLTHSHIGMYSPGMARAATTADAFNAIAEPRRREILDVLAGGERAVNDLVDELGLSQPQVSKHLAVLREVGAVRVRDDGRQRLYRVDTRPLKPIHDWVSAYEQTWNERFEALDGVLGELQQEEEDGPGGK